MQWETVIGLEIHAQLATRSKIFSGASTAYGAEPNTQACAVDLGLPGVLPVVNREAITMAVRFGLAIDAQIAPLSVFARKNYFYPDLPKGYQISQYEDPIVARGRIDIDTEQGAKTINITRAHLEEDAGKSLHEDFHGATGIDLNRAGTPLLEIVSEPEMRSAQEAASYMREIHRLVRYLGICDGNMQEGSFRCDANVSVRPVGQAEFGTRAEIKNLNSFRFIERAIEYEVERQIDLIESGGKVVQETRLYDPDKDETRSLRSKEDAHDYRYFPDPDLLPVAVTQADIDAVRASLPELPRQKIARFVTELGLGREEATTLANDAEVAAYFERAVAVHPASARQVANWVMGELFAALNRDNLAISASPIKAEDLGRLVERVTDGTLSGKLGKQVFQSMWTSGRDADAIIEAEGLRQVSDTTLIEVAVREVLAANADQVEQFRAGKDKVLGFLVGQVMKKTGGKANPALVNELIRTEIAR
ncbi:MAG: Asp-tRNA(Asn)/Glu-tRNA(Gln) amidotransferase subunit GatB [Gammaproteobacteria bacterium]|nr:Asp-tRNA(Asn)/Glu-tRNA(Gln) amidotransferase subunit GatB [Gammaproteobacteria bacterium]